MHSRRLCGPRRACPTSPVRIGFAHLDNTIDCLPRESCTALPGVIAIFPLDELKYSTRIGLGLDEALCPDTLIFQLYRPLSHCTKRRLRLQVHVISKKSVTPTRTGTICANSRLSHHNARLRLLCGGPYTKTIVRSQRVCSCIGTTQVVGLKQAGSLDANTSTVASIARQYAARQKLKCRNPFHEQS